LADSIEFAKMHGNGNDFILFDEFDGELVPEKKKPEFVKAVCDRRFGVGADGALFVQKSSIADAKFRYFNSDGSEAAMCGNGIRCFSRYLVEEGYAKPGKIRVETVVGVLELWVEKAESYMVKVNMGEVKTSAEEIPAVGVHQLWGDKFDVNGREFEIYAVNSGVPHVVIFVDEKELENLDIVPIARKIRYNEIFPEGTNVNFVSLLSTNEIKIRTYERGVEEETLSCGTGSVAAAFVSVQLGLVREPVRVVTKGGGLIVEFNGKIAYMAGSASRVFDGRLRLSELRFESID